MITVTVDSMGPSGDADVLILGAGIAGTMLASVLARNGASVIVLDAASHPRFAIGESTIPHTATMFRLVSERYGVPEIKKLATFANARAIASTFGIKRGFNFHYHEPGQPADPHLAHQVPIPGFMHTENHFLRQDLDAWLLTVAIGYGAQARQGVRITDIDLDDSGVTLISDRGQRWRGRYLIDAGGYRSPLANHLGLREQPTRMRHHSRSMFTHMIGVEPYERVTRNLGPTPASESTLHHIFPGGWIWVIPFNNHPRARSPLVSVGMTVDPRVHPRREDVPPGVEFAEFIDQFPELRRQFDHARPVREWTATGRLQYSSTRTLGPRWCLAMHAAGFLDPLFSRGLSFTMDFIHLFAHRLLDALAEDDFDVTRFAEVEALQQGLLDYNDTLVATAYRSFSSFEAWDAWIRVWATGEWLALLESNRSYARYRATGDPAVLARLERVAPHGSLPDETLTRAAFADIYKAANRFLDGDLTSGDAAELWITTLREANLTPPVLGLADPARRFFYAPPTRLPAILRWTRQAPPELSRNLREALALFLRIRLHPQEYNVREELGHYLAKAAQTLKHSTSERGTNG